VVHSSTLSEEPNVGKSTPNSVSTIPVSKPSNEPQRANTGSGAKSWSKATLGDSIAKLNATLRGTAIKAIDTDAAVELLEGEEQQPIVFERLLEEWHRIADAYKMENKINLFALMTARPPKLIGKNLIEMTVENTVQEDLLLVAKPDIVNALRSSLNNYAIDIKSVMATNDTARKPYTAQEKYQAMIAKNPLLDEFRRIFNLGLE